MTVRAPIVQEPASPLRLRGVPVHLLVQQRASAVIACLTARPADLTPGRPEVEHRALFRMCIMPRLRRFIMPRLRLMPLRSPVDPCFPGSLYHPFLGSSANIVGERAYRKVAALLLLAFVSPEVRLQALLANLENCPLLGHSVVDLRAAHCLFRLLRRL